MKMTDAEFEVCTDTDRKPYADRNAEANAWDGGGGPARCRGVAKCIGCPTKNGICPRNIQDFCLEVAARDRFRVSCLIYDQGK